MRHQKSLNPQCLSLPWLATIARAFSLLCADIPAEQTSLQISPSPETGTDTGVRLSQHSQLHLTSTSSWLPCGRRGAPFPSFLQWFCPCHSYQVQPNLSRPTKCSWLSPPRSAQIFGLSLPFNVCYPLTWASPWGHSQHLAHTRSWNQFKAWVMNSGEMPGWIPINKENTWI